MTNTVVRDDAASYQRDAALYAVISKHDFKPLKWNIRPEDNAAIAVELDDYFRCFAAFVEQRERAAEQHAPLFRVIK
jgi:hypothetical protein